MNQIVTLTGPSLSGKTTMMRKLQRIGGFEEIISHTTRPRRAGEVDHFDYHFVTEDEFDHTNMVEAVKYGDYRYGVAKASIENALESGLIPIVIVEPNGVSQLDKVAPQYGWKLCKVFVDINSQYQERRFVERMLADTGSSWETYRKRWLLIKQEQNWRGSHGWDYYISSFGPENEYTILLGLVTLLRRPDLQVSVARSGRAASVDA